MPLSKLKIDRTFIRRIATDRRDAALVKTIVGLGEALGIDIVAEGIELKEQADMLLECGCTIGQGYLFSRPRPAAEVPDMQAALRHRHRDATARAARQSARLMDQG
jgi:EAL domain-containing protein (putative c-di-GMP-specific phosphodiesterase class I)